MRTLPQTGGICGEQVNFSAIQQKWPRSWDAVGTKGNLLPRSNAFKAFMKFLKDDVYLDLVGNKIGKVPTIDEFKPYFARLALKDSDFTKRNFVPGSGGQSMFLKVLKNEIPCDQLFSEQ